MKLNDNMIIHVNNKIENEKFLKMCEDLEVEGIQDFYDVYGKYTCYHIENFHLYYSDLAFFRNDGYKIIEFEDLESVSDESTYKAVEGLSNEYISEVSKDLEHYKYQKVKELTEAK